ncbi:CHAT domain-containing protein [Actinoplanes subtropicus]|uniref:CHAT domain-containing protein n=1 Tax=Actinoplanes subtropicus TaxID=543632 RepID=UPI000691B721|nr:CHAT domain-containing protein [Actinoplanes subtropicus]
MGDIVHGDKVNGDKINGNKIVYAAGRPTPRAEPKVILLMSADADGRRPLGLDREHREVDAAIWNAHAGGRLEVRVADAVRMADLQRSLLRHHPVIAHFSGHGSAAYGIMVTDAGGRPRAVPPDALSDLFRVMREDLLCVVLNACFTEEQAHAIAEHIPCVIGMRGGILDDAAISFATAFYQAVAYGRTLGTAFELGCNQLLLDGHPDAVRPRLVATPGAAHLRVLERS